MLKYLTGLHLVGIGQAFRTIQDDARAVRLVRQSQEGQLHAGTIPPAACAYERATGSRQLTLTNVCELVTLS